MELAISPEIEQWAKNELKKMKFSDELINNLEIKNGTKFAATGPIPPYIITVNKDMIEEYKDPKHAGVLSLLLAHEAAHVEHNDYMRGSLCAVALPFIGHYGLKTLTYPFPKTSSIWLKAGLKIPSAGAKLAIMSAGYYIFHKYKEYAADKRAADGAYDSIATKNLSEIYLKSYEEYEKEHKLDPENRNTFVRFLYDEWHAQDPKHPNMLWRSQIFQKATKRLEQKENDN